MLNVWCKWGEVLVAWRCVVQGHHLKLLWPYVRTCLHPQLAIVCNFNIPAGEGEKEKTDDRGRLGPTPL